MKIKIVKEYKEINNQDRNRLEYKPKKLEAMKILMEKVIWVIEQMGLLGKIEMGSISKKYRIITSFAEKI